MTAEDFATRVTDRMPVQGNASQARFDPATILIILAIIKELVALYKSCKTPVVTGNDWADKVDYLRSITRDPGFINRWKFWWMVKRNVQKYRAIGFVMNPLYADDIARYVYDAMLEVGKGMSRDETQLLITMQLPVQYAGKSIL